MLTTNESVENYLETILVLSQKLPVVRSVDVANETGYKKSSVSVAMKNLREMCYIEVSDSGYITLTAAGKKIAEMNDMCSLRICSCGAEFLKKPPGKMPARSNTL